MRRYLCIYLPHWPCELSRRKTLQKKTPPANAVDCLEALQQLARWCLKFTPLAAVDADLPSNPGNPLYYGLALDISGTERLHRSEASLAEKIAAPLARAGFSARIAAAPTIGAAWAFSRCSTQRITLVIPGQQQSLKKLLGPLPVYALRISSETEAALQQLGLQRLRQVFALPPKSLLSRFGLRLLQRIDAACGAIDERIQGIQPEKEIVAARSFEVPLCTQKSIEIFTLKLFKEISNKLLQQNRQALSFLLTFRGRRPDGAGEICISKELPLAAAARNLQQLAPCISALLSTLQLRQSFSAGVSLIQLEVQHSRAAHALQSSLVSETELLNLQESKADLLNSLILRLSKSAVRRIRLEDSYLPERAFAYTALEDAAVPSPAVPSPAVPSPAVPPPAVPPPSEKSSTLPPDSRARILKEIFQERPPLLLPEPQQIIATALLPDNPPAMISIRGRRCRIISGSGPERIAEEWWQSGAAAGNGSRDYFKVQDQLGRWLWIFRDNTDQSWFLHGIWS